MQCNKRERKDMRERKKAAGERGRQVGWLFMTDGWRFVDAGVGADGVDSDSV